MSKSHVELLLPLAFGLSGCGQDPLVGELPCYGENISCEGQAAEAPNSLHIPADGLFDITAERSVPLEVFYENACDEGCNPFQMEPAPDGQLWLLASGPSQHELHRVGPQGEQLAKHVLGPAGGGGGYLSIDSQLNAVVGPMGAYQAPTSYARVDTVGATEMELPEIQGRLGVVLAGPPGEIRLTVEGNLRRRVEAFENDRLLWRQTELLDRLWYEQGESEQKTFNRPWATVMLSDGTLVMLLSREDGVFRSDGDTSAMLAIDSHGNLRWQAELADPLGGCQLKRSGDGFVLLSAPDGDSMNVGTFDASGKALHTWRGLRVDYHPGNPLAFCADSEGSVYTVHRAGSRDTREYVVCRMNALDKPGCVGLEGNGLDVELGPFLPGFPNAAYPETIVDMACPTPNVVQVFVGTLSQSWLRVLRATL